MNPLALLSRKDKWFLGGGKGALYAPPFPRWLEKPGYWDECYLADQRIPRLFTVLALDEHDRPVRLSGQVEEWRPDRLVLRHTGPGIVLRETRCVTQSNAWVSRIEVLVARASMSLVQWSMLELKEPGWGAPWCSVTDVAVDEGAIRLRWDTAWPASVEPDRTAVESEALEGSRQMLGPLGVHLAFGGSVPRHSWTVNLAQQHDEAPHYELSMLPEKLVRGQLPQDLKVRVGPPPQEGLLHAYQQFVLEPGETLVLACGAGLTAEDAQASLESALAGDAVAESERDWLAFFQSVPQFECSDPWFTAAYWYRWYGLRLNSVDLPGLPIAGSQGAFSPYVTEGIGFFRNFITYSAQAHLRELSWMRDPALALGILDNLPKCQREDGSYPGHSYSARPARDFYHSDFATGAAQLEALHGISIPHEVVDSLRRYVEYFRRERRLQSLGEEPRHWPDLYTIHDQNETGQEYMSRYAFASEVADQWGRFEVGGVDATTYLAKLLTYLAGKTGDESYSEGARAALDGLRIRAWDGTFFRDCSATHRSPAQPATGFYPLLIEGILEAGEAERLVRDWLANPGRFWLPAGFPATSADDDTFSSQGEWKEKRLNCPWNGRSWPMTNSHLVDAIATLARAPGLEHLRPLAAEAVQRCIRLLYHDGDPSRPNSYEHYDPLTGVPALYRGYDDYMHSWVVDLILRHVVGIRPGTAEVDPLPLGLEWFACTGVPHPEGRMNVSLRDGTLQVSVERDG